MRRIHRNLQYRLQVQRQSLNRQQTFVERRAPLNRNISKRKSIKKPTLVF